METKRVKAERGHQISAERGAPSEGAFAFFSLFFKLAYEINDLVSLQCWFYIPKVNVRKCFVSVRCIAIGCKCFFFFLFFL